MAGPDFLFHMETLKRAKAVRNPRWGKFIRANAVGPNGSTALVMIVCVSNSNSVINFHFACGGSLQMNLESALYLEPSSPRTGVNETERVTPLIVAAACRPDAPGLISTLIELNADVNHQTETGATALYHACRQGDVTIVQSLLDHNASVSPRMVRDGSMPIHMAAKYGHWEVIRLLAANNADLSARLFFGNLFKTDYAPLFIAVDNNQPLAAEELLRLGAPVSEPALYRAATKGDGTSVKMLLDYKATPSRHALRAACEEGHSNVVELLLKAKADPMSLGSPSALHIAAHGNHIAITACLIEAGADVNATSITGVSPLMVCTAVGHVECAKHLLVAGCSLLQRSTGGADALELAVRANFFETIQVLVIAGARTTQPNFLRLMTASNDMDVAFWLTYTEQWSAIQHLAASEMHHFGLQLAKKGLFPQSTPQGMIHSRLLAGNPEPWGDTMGSREVCTTTRSLVQGLSTTWKPSTHHLVSKHTNLRFHTLMLVHARLWATDKCTLPVEMWFFVMRFL
jgi:ankyrin repeat protein